MGIPLVPEPLKTPEEVVNSRVIRTHIYEPDELNQIFVFEPRGLDNSDYLVYFDTDFNWSRFSAWREDLSRIEDRFRFFSEPIDIFCPFYGQDLPSFIWRDTDESNRRETRFALALSLCYLLGGGGRCSEKDVKCLSKKDMRLKNDDDDKDNYVCFSFHLERINCDKVKKWFVHHIKDRPVSKLLTN